MDVHCSKESMSSSVRTSPVIAVICSESTVISYSIATAATVKVTLTELSVSMSVLLKVTVEEMI